MSRLRASAIVGVQRQRPRLRELFLVDLPRTIARFIAAVLRGGPGGW